MKKLFLSFFMLLLLAFVNTAFAKNITKPIRFFIVNKAECPFAFDPHVDNNCKLSESVVMNESSVWVTCNSESSFELDYNSDESYNHDAQLEFHHNIVPAGESYAYTYWMKNNAVGTNIRFNFIPNNPSLESFSLLPNGVATDDSQAFPGVDKLESDAYTIRVYDIAPAPAVCRTPPLAK